MTVFCGPSGSGKTSLAMDTIYAEGQRRYVESLSQLRPAVRRPAAEAAGRAHRRPLARDRHRADATPATRRARPSAPSPKSTTTSASSSPASASCTAPSATSRSARRPPTRSSTRCSPSPSGTKALHHGPASKSPSGRAVRSTLGRKLKRRRLHPRPHRRRNARARRNRPTIDRRRKHDVEVIVDRIIDPQRRPRSRIADSIENALALGRGVVHVAIVDDKQPESRWPVKRPQPAPRLRANAAAASSTLIAAPLLVQQLARLVPRVRRPRHAKSAPTPRRSSAACR